MSSPSNLYAEKVFSEHPVALWALDDANANFVSYITEENRKFWDYTNQWLYTNITSAKIKNYHTSSPAVEQDFIFPDSYITTLSPTTATEGSTATFHFSSRFDFDVTANNFSIGFYLYTADVPITNVKITVTADGGYSQYRTTTLFPKQKQIHVLSTFTNTTPLTNAVIDIQITHGYSGTSTDIHLNGLTVGSFSEEFSSTSLGISSGDLLSPSGIALSGLSAVAASAYATDDNVGYYLVKNNTLLAKNSSIPMVFGASNSTIITPSGDSSPSLILPGMGFMNESGKSTILTLEAWIKVNANKASQRIIGPISSTDGLYVDGPFLILKIKDVIGSYFVGEWFRPMLIQVSVSSVSASLIVNGESVVQLDVSGSKLTFASPKDSSGNSQDWIGFYASSTVPSIELDCVAIYPYEVNQVLAKRRFVYGQGAAYPVDVNVAYSGESLFIDYPFAGYAKTYDYPQTSSWLNSTSDNSEITSKSVMSPTYSLPELATSNASLTLDVLTQDLALVNDGLSVAPNNTWSIANSYLYFSSLNILKSPVVGIFGTFKKESSDSSTNQQVLIKLVNKTDNSYLKVVIEDVSVKYLYKTAYESEIQIPYIDESTPVAAITKGTSFSAGIHIDGLIEKYSYLEDFFASKDNISVYVLGDYSGGDSDLSTKFTGKAYGIGFMTYKNFADFSSFFDEGILLKEHGTMTGASYELNFTTVATLPKIDIKTKSYWDSNIGLSYFSTLAKTSDGTLKDTLDFIQLNIGYPQTRSNSTITMDPSDDLSKMYITFQYLADGANKPSSDFTDAASTSSQILVVEPDPGWKTKKYQVVDGSIIYPPTLDEGESFADLALCLHMETITKSSTYKPVSIRSIRLSSQSLSDTSTSSSSPINPISTRFGKSLYPYRELIDAGGGFLTNNISYKTRNPFKIFRESAPHLYLTNNSGISVAGEYLSTRDRGLFFRLNRDAYAETNVSSMQMAMMWNQGLFPTSTQKVFEIDSAEGLFEFYVKAITTDQKRAELTVKLRTGGTLAETSRIKFYWNGNSVARPVITVNEWGMLGIVFNKYLSFNEQVGYMKLVSPLVVNNISTYQLDATIQAQQIVYKQWEDILEDPLDGDSTSQLWSEYQSASNWEDLIYKSADVDPSLDPSEIYKIYIGTNKIIADSSGDSGVVKFNNYEYATYKNVQWDSYVASAI